MIIVMIISCTFRHSEQHIKSWTEMEYGKANISDIKKWPKSAPVFLLDTLKREPEYSRTVKENKFFRRQYTVVHSKYAFQLITCFSKT